MENDTLEITLHFASALELVMDEGLEKTLSPNSMNKGY
jgi:hypothetical protein